MMCSTRSTSTAYWSAERQLRSEWTTTFATLRWTNSSPGSSPTISFAGTRLSEHPIHKYFGDCCANSESKNPGRVSVMRCAHWRLFLDGPGGGRQGREAGECGEVGE